MSKLIVHSARRRWAALSHGRSGADAFALHLQAEPSPRGSVIAEQFDLTGANIHARGSLTALHRGFNRALERKGSKGHLPEHLQIHARMNSAPEEAG